MSSALARRKTLVCLAVLLNLLAAPALALAQSPPPPDSPPAATPASPSGDAVPIAASPLGPTVSDRRFATGIIGAPIGPPPAPPRPTALVPLYVSFASLQALDVVSSVRAIDRGGVEANPVMRSVLGSPAVAIALKSGVTALSIYGSEKIWKKHRAAAVAMMMAFNGAYAAIVTHNFAVVR